MDLSSLSLKVSLVNKADLMYFFAYFSYFTLGCLPWTSSKMLFSTLEAINYITYYTMLTVSIYKCGITETLLLRNTT